MTTYDYEYWPFAVGPAELLPSDQAEKVQFLQSAHHYGFESFRFGTNDYGARFKDREGCIIERGRMRWEIRLADGEQRRLFAFVDDFRTAGEAVTQWLGGLCAKGVLDKIRNHLITPPGAKTSHILSEEDCPA